MKENLSHGNGGKIHRYLTGFSPVSEWHTYTIPEEIILVHVYLQNLSKALEIQYWSSVVHSYNSHTEKGNDAVYLLLKGCR